MRPHNVVRFPSVGRGVGILACTRCSFIRVSYTCNSFHRLSLQGIYVPLGCTRWQAAVLDSIVEDQLVRYQTTASAAGLERMVYGLI